MTDKKAASKKATAKKATSKKATSKKATSEKATSKKATAKKATAKEATSVDAADPAADDGPPAAQPGPDPEETATPDGSTWMGEQDRYLFNEGTHLRLWEQLGAHLVADDAVRFAVWAPNAKAVQLVGDPNGWDGANHELEPVGETGIWAGTFKGFGKGDNYKYRVQRADGPWVDKADPFAFYAETPPRTASRVWDLDHEWGDDDWMASQGELNAADAPIAIYELHLGSWRRHETETDDDGQPRHLTYREVAEPLIEHLRALNFTHVEFLPVMQHPFDGSWGYQVTGYYGPTSRFGTPQDFMYLVDQLHQAGFGVVLDWVPSHFPTDGWALAQFDGTYLYEHADPRKGFHPDWKSAIYNYGRNEVRSFLLSSAHFWLETFHVDGLRVDGVASMLYLDYSREDGEWIPNEHGGNENLDAISFLRELNETVYDRFPHVQTYAEESTAWPGVSRPTYAGGLGFGFKWDMGWMHDTLEYFQRDPIHRRYHHDKLTFRAMYMGSESYTLPLSHDEVVHGKGSLWEKMPGDAWRKAANLRSLLGYMFVSPGKKLLFQGQEFGQWTEWDHDSELPWDQAERELHAGVQRFLGDAAKVYRDTPALHRSDTRAGDFVWVDASDVEQSVISFRRRFEDEPEVLVVANLTPVPRRGYRVGVPYGGVWREALNSDAEDYGGSGVGNLGRVEADDDEPMHGMDASVELALPPLGILVLVGEDGPPEEVVQTRDDAEVERPDDVDRDADDKGLSRGETAADAA